MILHSTLENHFKNLDKCELGDNNVFSLQTDKEHYESYIMFAFRKFKSLDYHFSNISCLINKEITDLEEKDIQESKSKEFKRFKKLKIVMKMKKDAYEFIYELSAFLEALKSCMDLLAEVASFYFKGINVNYSISPLLKLSNKKKSKILDFISNNANWIRIIRNYRHPIVHRLVLQLKSGYEIHQINGKSKKILYPILIPKVTPKFIPDTRKSRMMDNEENELDNAIYSTETCKIIKDGVEEILDFSMNIEAGSGYIRIEDFMKNHKNRCEVYFIEFIRLLDKLNFKFDFFE
jgi:hypothetical protein